MTITNNANNAVRRGGLPGRGKVALEEGRRSTLLVCMSGPAMGVASLRLLLLLLLST